MKTKAAWTYPQWQPPFIAIFSVLSLAIAVCELQLEMYVAVAPQSASIFPICFERERIARSYTKLVCSNDDPSGQATSAALQPNRQQPMRNSRQLGSRQTKLLSVFAIGRYKSSERLLRLCAFSSLALGGLEQMERPRIAKVSQEFRFLLA